jgi:hypothetical protein
MYTIHSLISIVGPNNGMGSNPAWGGTAPSWGPFGLSYTEIKNSISRLQPPQEIPYDCYIV